jgi:putative methyltransferase (TIGR04325 family)
MTNFDGQSMNYREVIKLLIPPLILKALRRKSHAYIEFDDYLAARRAALEGAYEDLELVSAVVDKNQIFRETLQSNNSLTLTSLRTLIPLASMQIHGRLKVIDFGGGGGMHYFIARAALDPNIAIRWNIVETKNMVELAQKNSDVELNFFEDLHTAHTELGNVDLIFTSSTLQYCANPLGILRKLLDLDAEYLFITRTPFLEGFKQIVTVQTSRLSDNGPGPLPKGYKDRSITYPITYVDRVSVERIIGEKYDIRFRIDEGESSFRFKNQQVSMTGYFCVKRPN